MSKGKIITLLAARSLKLAAYCLMLVACSLTLAFIPPNDKNHSNKDLICQNYWAIPEYNLIQMRDSFPSDTLRMENIHIDKIPENKTYLSILKFNANGTFEEHTPKCGESRINHYGTWTIDTNFVTVQLENNLIWHFQILSISKKKLVTIHSIDTSNSEKN